MSFNFPAPRTSVDRFHMNDGQAWRIALRKTMSPGKAKKKKAARRSPTRPANKNPGASHKSLGAVKRCSSPDAQLFMPVSPWTPEPPGPPPCKPKMSLPVAGSPEAQTEAGLEKARERVRMKRERAFAPTGSEGSE